MAGPIKIAVLADAASATSTVKGFSADVERSVTGAADSVGRAATRTTEHGQTMARGLDRAGDAADGAEGKSQGFADTLSGVSDAMAGAGQIAEGDLLGGLITLGTGFASIASGAVAFLIPALQGAAGAMKALNLTFLTNPIFLVVVAVVALVAVFIIAYKKSETFRRIVDGAFRGVLNAARAVWQWIRSNWPLLLAIITGPIGLAVRFVLTHFDTIKAKVKAVPAAIRAAFGNAGSLLTGAGRAIVSGLWNGIAGLAGWLRDKVTGFINSTVPGPIRRALGISSPSRVARGIGRFFGRGLGLGLGDETDQVRRAAATLAGATITGPPGLSTSAAAGAGAGGTVVLDFGGSSDPLVTALVRELRKFVRVKGGNVQVVLGS